MYDRRLDSVVAAADCGSFSKAAKQLGVSTPALAKRIETFEGEYGIELFSRTRRGVFLTPAGASIVEDARAIMRMSEDVLRRAREQEAFGGVTVRVGISAACPPRAVLDAWPRIHEADPSLHVELVPIGDIYDDELGVVANLGGSVDIIEVSDVSAAACEKLWGGVCRIEPLPVIDQDAEGPSAAAASSSTRMPASGSSVLLCAARPSFATARFITLLKNASEQGRSPASAAGVSVAEGE